MPVVTRSQNKRRRIEFGTDKTFFILHEAYKAVKDIEKWKQFDFNEKRFREWYNTIVLLPDYPMGVTMGEARAIYRAELWKVSIDWSATALEPPLRWKLYDYSFTVEPLVQAELARYGDGDEYFLNWLKAKRYEADDWTWRQNHEDIPEVEFDMNKVDTPPPRTCKWQELFEYRPECCYHNLAGDEQVQKWLYGDLFDYDFSMWPSYFWLRSKYETHSIEQFIETINLTNLFPYAVRKAAPNPFIDICIYYAIEHGGMMGIDIYKDVKLMGVYLSSHISGISELEKMIKDIYLDYVNESIHKFKPMQIEFRYCTAINDTPFENSFTSPCSQTQSQQSNMC